MEDNASSTDLSFRSYLGLSSNVSWGFSFTPVHGVETSLLLGFHPYADNKPNRIGDRYISPTFSKFAGLGLNYSFNFSNYFSDRSTLNYWELSGLLGANIKYAGNISYGFYSGVRLQANPCAYLGVFVEPGLGIADNQLDIHEDSKYAFELRPSLSAGILLRLDDNLPENRIRFYDQDINYLPTRFIPDLSLKTNLLLWAMVTPNIGAEIPIGKRFSVAAEYMFPWFKNRVAGLTYQLIAGNLEGRYWLNKHTSMQGHFVGLYTGGGYYDFQYMNKGYQGEFYIASGINYGYVLPLCSDIALEASLGIGFLSTHFREYTPEDGCLVYQKTQATSYFGPTKANIGIIWRIGK